MTELNRTILELSLGSGFSFQTCTCECFHSVSGTNGGGAGRRGTVCEPLTRVRVAPPWAHCPPRQPEFLRGFFEVGVGTGRGTCGVKLGALLGALHLGCPPSTGQALREAAGAERWQRWQVHFCMKRSLAGIGFDPPAPHPLPSAPTHNI